MRRGIMKGRSSKDGQAAVTTKMILAGNSSPDQGYN